MSETQEAKIVLNESDIQKFDPTIADLQRMVENTKDITADTRIDIIKESRIDFKKRRVQIEKYGKSLRDEANKFNKAVLAKENELIAIIEPEERRLEKIEKDAEAKILIESRREKIPARRERLAAIGDGVEISDDDLLLMDANNFEAYVNLRVGDKLEKEKLEYEAEQKEKDRVAREKLAADQKIMDDERKKLDEEREEIERQKQKLEDDRIAREKKIEDDKKAREKEEADLAEEKEREERNKIKLERAEKYRNWREQYGWTEETKAEWYEKVEGEGDQKVVILFKKVSEFHLN